MHEGDVKVLLSWRARSDVLAKLWPVDENPFLGKGCLLREEGSQNCGFSTTN